MAINFNGHPGYMLHFSKLRDPIFSHSGLIHFNQNISNKFVSLFIIIIFILSHLLQLSTHHPDLYGFFGQKNPVINKTLGKQEMNETLFLFPDTQKIINHYLSDSVPENFSDTVRKQVYTAFGDFSIVCPQTFYAEQCAAKGKDVYYYVFNHRPSNTPWAEWMGVAHGSELEFVFGNPLLYPTYYPADEVQLSKTIIDIWSTFAKTG